jgi:hypothetical protein
VPDSREAEGALDKVEFGSVEYRSLRINERLIVKERYERQTILDQLESLLGDWEFRLPTEAISQIRNRAIEVVPPVVAARMRHLRYSVWLIFGGYVLGVLIAVVAPPAVVGPVLVPPRP